MERVFPIRCTVSENSPNLLGDHQKAGIYHRTVLVESPSLEKPATVSEGQDAVAEDVHCVRPTSAGADEALEAPPAKDTERVDIERCEYAFINGEGHGIVSGKRERFTRCEDEPIQMPGAVQSHGMLVGLEVIEDLGQSRYGCRVVSDNSEIICKHTPRDMLQLDDFLRIVPAHKRAIFENYARIVIRLFKKTSKSDEPKVFSMSFVAPSGDFIPAWCAMHFLGGNHQLLVCEFELEASLDVDPNVFKDVAWTPYNSLNSDPIDSPASFVSKSDPLNISDDAGNMFQREGNTIEVVTVMGQIQQQLSQATSIQDLLDAIVGITQELSGFHRCMVYQFDEEYNGTIVAELVNPQATSDIYRGLHFPASDIPKQARDLYKLNRVRSLFDRDSEPSRLVTRSIEDLATPVDLTHSYLRAMSPVHLKYLGNMGVKSTMSVALNHNDKLWGLICCHSYGPAGLRVPFPTRELCYWVGLCASNCLDKLLNAEKLESRQSLISMHINVSPQLAISASSQDLLRLFLADFGFLVVKGEARTIGKLSSYAEAVTLLRYVYFRNFSTSFATKNIAQDFVDLVYKPGFQNIGGLLVIPLSQDAGDFIVLFRTHQIREVHWAGNPNMSKMSNLEPRHSFKKWTETVKANCKPWSPEQLEIAAMTRLVYGNFIRVWRDKDATVHESRMKRLLLLNLSHEVRTPLNAVVNYLEIALERQLDEETKEVITQSHSASKSLVYVIDDLLHLTASGYRPSLPMLHASFELSKCLENTFDQLRHHAVMKDLYFDVSQDSEIAQHVCGDADRFSQALTQLVTNAIKNTKTGGISIHISSHSTSEDFCLVQIGIKDTGVGISERALDELFQEFEQIPDEETNSDEALQEAMQNAGEAEEESRLGLGLALVARYVKQSGGQIRGLSSLGKGSTFTLDIPMRLGRQSAAPSRSGSSTSTVTLIPSKEDSSGSITEPTSIQSVHTESSYSFPDRTRRLSEQSITRDYVEESYTLATPLGPASTVGATVPGAGGTNELSILVADDNTVNLSILKRRLERMGHKVRVSMDGQQCFAIFREFRESVDFILMDINMPLVDGIQSTKMIRALEAADPRHDTQADTQAVTEIPPPPVGGAMPTISEVSHPISPPPTNSGVPGVSEPQAETGYFPYIPISPATSAIVSSEISVPPIVLPPPLEMLSHESSSLADQPHIPKHVPIFAVSAGLDQHTEESLRSVGFDGWLSKPIDFKKLSITLQGITSQDTGVKATHMASGFAIYG